MLTEMAARNEKEDGISQYNLVRFVLQTHRNLQFYHKCVRKCSEDSQLYYFLNDNNIVTYW